uniref:Uncharacterized protein n=1 Tax=Tetraselmis sp. GSL018 TaxID=582737 RepID=A0A061RKW6_9CHLO
MAELAELRLGVRHLTLSGIPMNKRKRGAEGRELHSVQLRCRQLPEAGPFGGAQLPAELAWSSSPHGGPSGFAQPARAVWQVSLMEGSSSSGLTLAAYLQSGRVAYVREAGADRRSPHPAFAMLQRREGLFLHELWEPLPADTGGAVQGREVGAELGGLRLGAFDAAVMSCVGEELWPPPLCPEAPGSGTVRLPERADIITCDLLERQSRFLPLEKRELLSESQPPLWGLVKPVLGLLQQRQVDSSSFSEAREILKKLQECVRSNDSILLHHGVLDPELRRRLYAGAWAELRAAAKVFANLSGKHKSLSKMISTYGRKVKPDSSAHDHAAKQGPSEADQPRLSHEADVKPCETLCSLLIESARNSRLRGAVASQIKELFCDDDHQSVPEGSLLEMYWSHPARASFATVAGQSSEGTQHIV